ncbi:MAG: lmo0937 family membrane protein [bacterium]
MLTNIALVLLIIWLLGFFGLHLVGGFIHILLVVAVALFLIRIIRGENPLT